MLVAIPVVASVFILIAAFSLRRSRTRGGCGIALLWSCGGRRLRAALFSDSRGRLLATFFPARRGRRLRTTFFPAGFRGRLGAAFVPARLGRRLKTTFVPAGFRGRLRATFIPARFGWRLRTTFFPARRGGWWWATIFLARTEVIGLLTRRRLLHTGWPGGDVATDFAALRPGPEILDFRAPPLVFLHMAAVIRHVLPLIPVLLDEIHRAVAGVVKPAIVAPAVGLLQRDIQVERRRAHYHRANDDGLRIEQHRWRRAVDVDGAVKTLLANIVIAVIVAVIVVIRRGLAAAQQCGQTER
jgi:hypothetical protein